MTFSGARRGARQYSSPGSELAPSVPAQEGRPEGFGGTQGEPGTREHSGGYLVDLRIRIRDGYPRRVITHENCHLTKTLDLEGFLKVVRSIDSFLVVGG
jgi:hypothetical protein